MVSTDTCQYFLGNNTLLFNETTYLEQYFFEYPILKKLAPSGIAHAQNVFINTLKFANGSTINAYKLIH